MEMPQNSLFLLASVLSLTGKSPVSAKNFVSCMSLGRIVKDSWHQDLQKSSEKGTITIYRTSGAKNVSTRTENLTRCVETSSLHSEDDSISSPLQYGMYVYETEKYEKNVTQFPINLSYRSRLYIELTQRYTGSSTGKLILPETCHVNASPEPAYTPMHQLVFAYCPIDNGARYEPFTLSATRFSFLMRQFFGVNEQFLFLHCRVTLCERKEKPRFDWFDCNNQAQYCPQKGHTALLTGPFTVWPYGANNGESLLTSTPETLTTSRDVIKEDSISFVSAMILATGTFLLGTMSLGLILIIFQCRRNRKLAIALTKCGPAPVELLRLNRKLGITQV